MAKPWTQLRSELIETGSVSEEGIAAAKRSFMLPVLLECHLCGYSRPPEGEGQEFHPGCACLDPRCDGESGDECEPVLLCIECL